MIEGPDQSYYAVAVEDETPPHVPDYAEVQGKVADNYEADARRHAQEIVAANLLAAAKAGALDVLFLHGADEIAVEPGAFTVYIGTNGDRGAARADVILPASTYTEKSGIYVNTEGRVQVAERCNFPPGDAREDWAILRALSDVLGHRLAFDSLGQLRQAIYAAHPHMARVDDIAEGPVADFTSLEAAGMGREPFVSPITDFYLTNPIARSSKVMAEASALSTLQGRTQEAAE